MSPVEVMFVRKIKSVFDKFLPNQWKPEHKKWIENDSKLAKVFFRLFQSNKSYWKTGAVDKHIGNMIYIIKRPRFTRKRHLNQIRKWYSNTADNNSREEDLMDVVFDILEVPIPQMAPELRRFKRKREITDLIQITPPQKKEYWLQTKQG